MIIRYATKDDIAAITAVEAACFPPAEAATEEEFVERVNAYGNHFWLMFDDKKLIAFVDGFVTDEKDLTDEMYENAAMHDENGAWQMIFGVNTIPDYRKRECAKAHPFLENHDRRQCFAALPPSFVIICYKLNPSLPKSKGLDLLEPGRIRFHKLCL